MTYNKIIIIGDAGRGKTTLAEKLSQKLGIKHYSTDDFYYKKHDGKTKQIFAFYKIEEIVYDFINKYPNKNILINIINQRKKASEKKYPESFRLAKKAYFTERCPEGVGYKDNNLLKNPYFVGFYIKGKMTKDILKILKEKYPDKIIFNGSKIFF